MTPFLIIGIAGRIDYGKDVAADYLRERYRLRRWRFAHPLKCLLADLLGVPVDDLETIDKNQPLPELGGKTLRQAMQSLGTGWGRNVLFQDVWIQRAQRDLLETQIAAAATLSQPAARGWIASDVRFENEAELIRRNGGLVIRIERDIPRQSACESEDGIKPDARDVVCLNDGRDLDEFRHHLETIVDEWQAKRFPAQERKV